MRHNAYFYRFAAVVLVAGSLALPATSADKTVAIADGKIISARCVGVHDGDSMTLLIETADGKRQAKIRLDAIDAPELGQPFSRQSKEALADLVFQKTCEVESRGEDKYGRTIGRVTIDGIDVNATMLATGMAWHYKKYDDREDMASIEEAAKEAAIGLWAEPQPTPPWEWRKMGAEQRRKAVGVSK